MNGDPGYFGPSSMMWKVNKEITVLFGGARALLMHAAHPLIAAGARQTSFYQRDPWKRLIRTLSLQNSVTFGNKEEADDSAIRINRLHEVIKGEDEVTGKIYDALDHEQLLWVHACLQISSIYFYENDLIILIFFHFYSQAPKATEHYSYHSFWKVVKLLNYCCSIWL